MFPQYRKLSNHKSFYKILSDHAFEEIQLVGSKTFNTRTKATKYPEIIRIKEMIECVSPFLSSSAEEFNHFKVT